MPKVFPITWTQAGTSPHCQQLIRLRFGIWKRWRRTRPIRDACISTWEYYYNVYILFNPLNIFRSINSDTSHTHHRIPLRMCLQTLRMRRITWPMCTNKFFPHIWNRWPRFAYSMINLYGCTIRINWVKLIYQNSAWPCAHSYLRMSRITPALNETVNLLPRSFSRTTISSNFGDLAALRAILTTFHCACTETAICEFQVKLLTLEFDFLTPVTISLLGTNNDISVIWRRFLLIFAFDIRNVRHTSTSGLLDLLT